MYLINWMESNIMVFITLLILFAIPVIIVLYVFRKRTGPEANIEEYLEKMSEEEEKEEEVNT